MVKERALHALCWIVMVAVLAVLLHGFCRAMAFRPGYAPINGCKANLMQIQAAKATWAEERGKGATDVPTASELFGPDAYIRERRSVPWAGPIPSGRSLPSLDVQVTGHTL